MSGIIGSKFNHRGSGLVGSLGTDGQHMLSSGAGKKHVFETVATVSAYDDEPIKSDLTALAIREATNEASAAFNLPGSFIETFTDDTNLGTQTTGDRDSGYWASATAGSQTPIAYGTGTIIGDGTVGGGIAATFDNNTDQAGHSPIETSIKNSTTFIYAGKDWGSGNTRTLTGAKSYGANNEGYSSSGSNSSGCTWEVRGGNTDVLGDSTVLGTLSNQNFRDYATDNNSIEKLSGLTATAYRYHFVKMTAGTSATMYIAEIIFYDNPLTTNSTATLIQSANSVTGSRTSVGGTFMYKDNAGTASIGTDLKIYFTANGGTHWTEAEGYNAITPVYASGIKQVRLDKTTVTGGTDVRYKAVWANQSAGSKETQLHAIGINY